MRPTLEVGDLLIVVGADPYSLKVGDIIVFRTPWSGSLIVHRIIRIDRTPAGPIFYTKGDNNALPDPGFRTIRDIYGKVVLRIPYVGTVLELLQTLPAKLAIVGIIAAYLLYQYAKMMGEGDGAMDALRFDQTEYDEENRVNTTDIKEGRHPGSGEVSTAGD